MACFGYCLIKQLSVRQILGELTCYLVLILGGAFLSGQAITPDSAWVEEFLISGPFVAIYAGLPILTGYAIYRGIGFRDELYWSEPRKSGLREITGLIVVYTCSLLLVTIATSFYFDRPWGFFYRPGLVARAFIELSTVLAVVLGLPAVIGHVLLRGRSFREALGSLVLFFVVASGIMVTIQLTIGYELLALLLNGR